MNARVCLVTGELEGPSHNGGVGTTNRALAVELARLGYHVDILYTHVTKGQPLSLRGSFRGHQTRFSQWGVRLDYLRSLQENRDWRSKSYHCLKYLESKAYDIVFFDDLEGSGYYSQLAKKTGAPAFERTVFCVTTHGATQWYMELNKTPVGRAESLPLVEMERRSIELADVVKSPSAYVLEKYKSYGWNVPANASVIPNFVTVKSLHTALPKFQKITEIVFFGRLETRKGLWIFCECIERQKYSLGAFSVTFLGKSTPETAALIKRVAGWPLKVRVLDNFDQRQALDYLRGNGRLAVMPSPEDNSPSVILECIEEGIPFIASAGSGGEELVAQESRSRVLFAPSVDGLTDRLTAALTNGATAARASIDRDTLRERFAAWVEGLLPPAYPKRVRAKSVPSPSTPLLLLVVPPSFDVAQAKAAVGEAAGDFPGGVEITLIYAEPAGPLASAKIVSAEEFALFAQRLKRRKPTVVAVCRIDQVVGPEWIERAQKCFAADLEIGALTGMTIAQGARPTNVSPSGKEDPDTVARYLTGYAPALFALEQETNSGFAIFRSDHLAELGEVSPFDEVYGRLKRVDRWIHELLVTDHIRGHRFELVPDMLLGKPADEESFETDSGVEFARDLLRDLYRYAPGSDQYMVAQVGVDAGLQRDRSRIHERYRESVEARTGLRIVNGGSQTPWAGLARQLATLAHSSGQIDLSLDLSVSAAAPVELASGSDLDGFVSRSSKTVEWAALIKRNRYRKINLNYPYSFSFSEQEGEIDIHANPASEGVATLGFFAVDLEGVDAFSAVTWLPKQTTRPVRVRMEVASVDRLHRVSSDLVLRPERGRFTEWDFDLPVAVRTVCDVLVVVEMAHPGDDARDAFVRLSRPRFVNRGTVSRR